MASFSLSLSLGGRPPRRRRACAVLGLDKAAERALRLGRKVTQRVNLHPGTRQQRHPLRERQPQRRAGVHQRRERVLAGDGCELGPHGGQAVKQAQEDGFQHVQNLEVVLFDRHFKVQAGELAEVAVRVAVLGAEHGAHLVHALEVAHHGHLWGGGGIIKKVRGAA